MVGLNQAQIDGARHLESSDPRTLAALTFAQSVIDRRGGVGESDIKAVRTAGFSDAEIAEIVAAVALNFFTNFFNRAFDVDVDFPRVEAHNHAAAR
jgi:alkylhydroperoxidase family enzyme